MVSPWRMTPSDCSRLCYLNDRSVTRPATDNDCDWSGLNRITGRAGLSRVFRKTHLSVIIVVHGMCFRIFSRHDPSFIRLYSTYVVPKRLNIYFNTGNNILLLSILSEISLRPQFMSIEFIFYSFFVIYFFYFCSILLCISLKSLLLSFIN